MSTLNVDAINDAAGTGAPDFPNGLTDGANLTAQKAATVSTIVLDSGNGHGSSGTSVRRFTNVGVDTGTAFTQTQDATNGDSVQVDEAGVYAISVGDTRSTGTNSGIGISKNASSTSTSITGLAKSERLAVVNYDPSSGNSGAFCSAVVVCAVNDVIRFHDDGSGDGTSVATFLRIEQLVKF